MFGKQAFTGYPGSIRPVKQGRARRGVLLTLFLCLLAAGLALLYAHISARYAEKTAGIPRKTPPIQEIQTNLASVPYEETPQEETPQEAEESSAAPRDWLILVNASHPLPDDYDVSGMVCLNDMETSLFSVKEPNSYLLPEVADAFERMVEAAAAEGLTVWQVSEAYRSLEAQQQIWDSAYAKYRDHNGLSEKKALEATARRVAKPGCSEHHTGMALDVTVPGESFRKTAQCGWLKKHCAEYGFIIRYTEEKEKYTGISAEPWHIRYVGQEAAREMTDKNLCLEEYVKSRR